MNLEKIRYIIIMPWTHSKLSNENLSRYSIQIEISHWLISKKIPSALQERVNCMQQLMYRLVECECFKISDSML